MYPAILRRGAHPACYVRQDTVAGMVRWLYDFHESLPEDVAVSYFMEANFMQDIILDEFAREGDLRGYQLPIMPRAAGRSPGQVATHRGRLSPLGARTGLLQ